MVLGFVMVSGLCFRVVVLFEVVMVIDLEILVEMV
jgi:hypothetical protein